MSLSSKHRMFLVLPVLASSLNLAEANNKQGAWSGLLDWPLIGIHALLNPDGTVLTYGTDDGGNQGISGGLNRYDV